MIVTVFHGFCMALADSVPGVSGGTIAFILGFYECFLDALHDLFRGERERRKAGLRYVLKLGLGWGVGMAACVILLSGLFAKNIYFMSSLFLGLTLCPVPFIVSAKRETLKKQPLRHGWFLLLGVAAVVALTLLRTGMGALGFGVVAGAGLSIHAIRAALRSCRSQMVWLILGLMLGSLYAIANGPASLDTPLPPLDAATFQLPAFLLGTAILLALEGLKKATKRREQANGALQKGESLS